MKEFVLPYGLRLPFHHILLAGVRMFSAQTPTSQNLLLSHTIKSRLFIILGLAYFLYSAGSQPTEFLFACNRCRMLYCVICHNISWYHPNLP